jgi:hypothetical protein
VYKHAALVEKMTRCRTLASEYYGALTSEGFPVNARIFLKDDQLVAELPFEEHLTHSDAVSLADMLWKRGVKVAEVEMLDWHVDADRAPTSGQKIAVYQRLRLLEQSKE